MNQDLKNYITQSRVAGQTDEQIKQALKSSGWQEVDINQAFAGQLPATEMVSVATGSWLTSKILAGLVIGFVIAGGAGAYFIFRDRQNSSSIPIISNTPIVQNTESDNDFLKKLSEPGVFGCRDVFNDENFSNISGYALSYYNMTEKNSVSELDCDYVTKKTSGGVPESLLTLHVLRGDMFGHKIDQTPTFNLWENNLKITAPHDGTPVQGLGADSYTIGGVLGFLSSNKYYLVTLLSYQKNLNGRLNDMGKIIDANLNKY